MNWYKTAIRGNLERMNNPNINPYRHSKPGEISDGSLSYMTQFGDESGSSGSSSVLGTRTRKGFPRGISSQEYEYDIQMKRDIPSSTHMFVDDHDETMKGTGQGVDSTKKQDFTDYRDRLPQENETFKNNPAGVFNMHTLPSQNKQRPNIFKRLRKRVKGAYYD